MSNFRHVKTAYPCQGEQLKHFRKQHGWTQAELAEKAGYSTRLISKAESSQSISSDTIADLAEALSTEDSPCYPEDLISDPVQVARRYVEAHYELGPRAFEAIEPLLHDDVVIIVRGEPSEIPFAGTFHGKTGAEEMLRRFFGVLEVPDRDDLTAGYHYISHGNEVVIWGESWLHPHGVPLDKPVEVTIRMQFSRGKLIHFEDRFDVKTGCEALARGKQV